MEGRQQGSSFTNMHEAAGEPPTAPPPPPSIAGQAPAGYTVQDISFTPISFPVGIVSSSSPRDGLNDRSPPDHASKNSLSSQDVQLSVKLDGHQGRGDGLNPHVSPNHSDMAGAPESGVLRFPSAAPIIRFPKASAKKSVRAPEQRLSGNSNPGYENGAYLGPGQIRLSSGGVINLAMDDTFGEEPVEVRAMRGSRPPVGSTSGFSDAHDTGVYPPMHNMVMARQVEKEGCCGGRPLFGLWIAICVFLCFCTLFFGLVPLIFFWQAREEWDSGNTAKAKKSLRLAWIFFVVALLALTGGVAGLAVQAHLSQQAVDKAYREAGWG